ncbi:protein EARLY FLOWERING 3 [Vigna unguiculata]|uniref:Protein EARLY FLOWERING 3 n=1 Tax=Vigna unguiculata TaxID=3917 RepID=A0A4D6MNK3_VIGUN|nr:protein EARLY FLOWERING 3 [Vigna unguiculata]
MNRMRGGIEESKEISPMFPRLHVKDAEKGGPKAPPRNKMALYEQFSIPSQSFAPASPSLFPLPLRNYTPHTSSSHISSNQSIQFNSSAPSILAEKSQAYNFRRTNLTKYTVSRE